MAFLTISVVPGNELEGLVHKQHGQGELEDNDPLVKRQRGDVEDNLRKRLLDRNYMLLIYTHIEHGYVEDHQVKSK